MDTRYVWIFQLVITVVTGIIAYFLKETKKNSDEKLCENKSAIHDTKVNLEEFKKEFQDFKSELPMVYVLRDDFIRAMATVEKKLDKIYDFLAANKKEESL